MTVKGKNTIELVGYYGGDETHALSAWTSTSRDLDIPNKSGVTKRERIPAVLNMLAENHHETPFEKSTLHFLVKTDIATHIQLLKHRIGVSINGESARYKELSDKFYIPYDWTDEEIADYIVHTEKSYEAYHKTVDRLVARGVSRARAKESARFYLPYGNQLEVDIMFNFRSFYHFLTLRYSTHAQREICLLAREMLEIVDGIGTFDKTLRAFGLKNEDGSLREPF